MCDTLVSIWKNNSEKNVTYFAKNSDREPEEIQLVEYYPRTIRKGKVKVTYIDVDFEYETNAILISRPYWMWGAEMGVNEYGVAIGNEAIFTRRKFKKEGLLGMDLLRIGLEIGKDSKSALNVILDYLEKYGQGGSNSFTKKEYYDNSFLIADRNEAYLLEIFEKQWRSKKIDKYAAISNIPSSMFSEGDINKIDYKLNKLYSYFGKGDLRYKETYDFLQNHVDHTNILDIMTLMRSHFKKNYSPKLGFNGDICMHSGHFTRKFQTANSMILEIFENFIISWFTFSPNPCISLYKPLFFNLNAIKINYDKNYWIKNKKLHEKIARLDPKEYEKVMNLTLENQMKINKIVDDAKDKILIGNLNFNFEKIYESILEIDKKHMLLLQSI